MMKGWVLVMVGLSLLGGACRKRAPLVQTPVSQLDPLQGAAPVQPQYVAENSGPTFHQPVLQPASSPDGGAPKAVMTPPKTTTTPTVASPYIPGGGSEHLPMWRQRAKFY
jgi:hypothetical protein